MSRYINKTTVKIALAAIVGYYVGKNDWNLEVSVHKGNKNA